MMTNYDLGYEIIFTVDSHEVLRFEQDSCLLGGSVNINKFPHTKPIDSESLEGARLDVGLPGRPHGMYAHLVYGGQVLGKTTVVGLSSLRFRVRGAVVGPDFGGTFVTLAASCDWSSIESGTFSTYLKEISPRERAVVVAAWQAALVVRRPLELSVWMWENYAMPLSNFGYEPFDRCARSEKYCTDLYWTLQLLETPPIFSKRGIHP